MDNNFSLAALIYIAFRTLLGLIGVAIIAGSIFQGWNVFRGDVDFFLALAAGVGLMVAPFTTIGMLLTVALILASIVGFPVLGFYIGAQVFHEPIVAIAGVILGFFAGYRFVSSSLFDLLLAPLRFFAKKENF